MVPGRAFLKQALPPPGYYAWLKDTSARYWEPYVVQQALPFYTGTLNFSHPAPVWVKMALVESIRLLHPRDAMENLDRQGAGYPYLLKQLTPPSDESEDEDDESEDEEDDDAKMPADEPRAKKRRVD